MNIKWEMVREGAKKPEYASSGAAGMDLFLVGDYTIQPGETVRGHLGWKVEIPLGWYLDIRPRSSIRLRYPFLKIVNSPIAVDSDYRGELFILLQNCSNMRDINLKHGLRIVQAIFQMAFRPMVNEFVTAEPDGLKPTNRGDKCLGSTGEE